MVGFADRGWLRFAADPVLRDWVRWANALADNVLNAPAQRAQWLHCQDTWFVGVDSLPNDVSGSLPGTGPLNCPALDMVQRLYGPLPLHRGQLSVTWPGYPRPRAGESDTAFRYRRDRDAAHLDGLLAIGPDRRRMLREPHAYILGIPLNAVPIGASPLVVWEGSHQIIGHALAKALNSVAPADWPNTDLTEIYHTTRRQIFDSCPRVEITAAPGECYLLHRHSLHGIAPWSADAPCPDGRRIVYFRPQFSSGSRDWISAP